MAYNFPNSPTIGTVYSGYTWDGEKWTLSAAAGIILRSYLAGLSMSTAGASTSITVAPGVAANSTNVDYMTLSAALTKTTAAWAVGSAAGGLDTGAIAANMGYHFYLIKRPDTGVVDVCFSLSATAPTFGTNIPAAYTLFRRIGWMKTNASSQWALFKQLGDEFIWSTGIQDVNVATFSTTPTLYTLGSVPQGFQVLARVRINAFSSSAALASLFTSPDEASGAAGNPAGNYNTNSPAASTVGASSDLLVRTNTVAQIRGAAIAGTTNTLQLITIGWTDWRGRND